MIMIIIIDNGGREREKETTGWRIVIRFEQIEWRQDNQCSGRVGNQLSLFISCVCINE